MNPNPSEIVASTRSVAHLICPKLPFVHAGEALTLNKHPKVQQALRRGEITPQQALLKPWYLRKEIGGKERLYKLAVKDTDALRAAKDILNGRLESPTIWAAFQAAQDAKQSITLGQLAQAWTAAGCPHSKTRTRPPEAAERMQATLARALDFWHSVPAGTVNHSKIEDFVVWRRRHVRAGARFTGSRSADLELAALSSLCQWAQHTGQIDKNPFESRDIYTTDVRHCHEKMCDNDEQFHQLLSWFWHQPSEADRCRHEVACAGAWLALNHLTGLRPGEPEFLKYTVPLSGFPTNFDAAARGQIYPMPDGTMRMKVQRLKRGQNPQVLISVALRAFLDVWTTWLKCHGYNYGDKLVPVISQDRVSRPPRPGLHRI